ncbi:MAG: hypothetical protein M3443_09965 [Actinomycetota bacterium]|nr:hypothetical protein [Actinomycetota bacterium]
MSTARVPLFEAALLEGLRKVQRGVIGAIGECGVLRQRVEDMPVRIFGALAVLRRDRLIDIGTPEAGGWCPARLTAAGSALLNAWENTRAGLPQGREAMWLLTLRLIARSTVVLHANSYFLSAARSLPAAVESSVHEVLAVGLACLTKPTPHDDRRSLQVTALGQDVLHTLTTRRRSGCAARPQLPRGSRWICAPE